MSSTKITLFLVLICVLPSAAQEKATPKNGEGITLFLKRHNRVGIDYQKEFIQLNKEKLGENNTLLLGVQYTLLPLQKESIGKRAYFESLFGKALASYKVTSSDLKGACFYLVSGHGGSDPGAIGRIGSTELHEDEYAYDIVLRLARNLMMRGAKVHILIQDNKDGIRNDRYLKNSKRAIFIHIDSRSKSHQTDVFFYYQNQSATSKRLAKIMRTTFHNKYKKHQPSRGFSGTVKSRNLYVLKNTIPASVFVELGNIQNRFDQQQIVLSENRQSLAN